MLCCEWIVHNRASYFLLNVPVEGVLHDRIGDGDAVRETVAAGLLEDDDDGKGQVLSLGVPDEQRVGLRAGDHYAPEKLASSDDIVSEFDPADALSGVVHVYDVSGRNCRVYNDVADEHLVITC